MSCRNTRMRVRALVMSALIGLVGAANQSFVLDTGTPGIAAQMLAGVDENPYQHFGNDTSSNFRGQSWASIHDLKLQVFLFAVITVVTGVSVGLMYLFGCTEVCSPV